MKRMWSVLLIAVVWASAAPAQTMEPVQRLLSILTHHWNYEKELINVVRVAPADFKDAVMQLTGEAPAPTATDYTITIRILSDPAHNRGFWTFDREP